MTDRLSLLEHNLTQIRQRIAAAAQRAGRDPKSVQLVAVTKYVSVEVTRALAQAGCRDLGESRPQDLWRKAEALQDLQPPVRWHLVGHLQRNKVRRTLRCVSLLHSTDSLRLMEELQQNAQSLAITCDTLLEVNVSGDTAKHGMRASEVGDVLRQLSRFPNVRVRGLMTMAALERPGEASRSDFRALQQLRQQLLEYFPDGTALDELSMGMSGDFETAIEEGATIVRIGSALFAGSFIS